MKIFPEYTTFYTQEFQSKQILNIFKKHLEHDKSNYTIVDATAGIGGNSSLFCEFFKYVYCIDTYENVIDYLENNLKEYNNKFIINENCLDILKIIQYDIIFFDPPWGGSSYKLQKNIDLYINDINIIDIINELYHNKKLKIIGLKAPINFNLDFDKYLNTDFSWKVNIYDIYKNDNKYILFKFLVFTK